MNRPRGARARATASGPARIISMPQPHGQPVCYSYQRWSTPEQGDGDSLRRQTARATAWAEANGFALSDATYRDEGVSAFSGGNVQYGALGAFLTAVRSGEVPRGSALYVEDLDRVSREHPLYALDTVKAIISAGVTLIDGSDGARYSEAGLLADGGTSLMILMMKMLRPHAESAAKRDRGKAVWSAKRDAARREGKPMTARLPAWLRKEGDKIVLVPERVATVRTIFSMAARGQSSAVITRRLNARGVPVFGPQGGVWYRTQVSKLLSNRAVLGEFTPHLSRTLRSGKRERGTAGEPIPGFFPPAITQAAFDAAQVYRGARTASPTGVVRNIFGRLLRCSRCGSALTRVSKGPQGGAYLWCDKRRTGAGHCDAPSVRYEVFQQAFLAGLPSILSQGEVWSTIHLEAQLAELAAQLAATDNARDNIVSVISAGAKDPALLDRLERLLAREDYAAEVAELEADLTRLRSPVMNRQRVWLEAQRDLAASRPVDVSLRLRTILARIEADTATGRCTVHWTSGGHASDLQLAFRTES